MNANNPLTPQRSTTEEKKPWGLFIAILVVPILLLVVPLLLKKL